GARGRRDRQGQRRGRRGRLRGHAVSVGEPAGGWLLGVDVGGTFTDLVLADGAGEIHTGKVPTTPHEPIVGVVDGVTGLLADAGVDAGAVARFVHGTTLATNVI